MTLPEIVEYPDDWVCRTDESASFTCSRRGVWRITSAGKLWAEDRGEREFVDFSCSIHLVGLLQAFTGSDPVVIDRERRGKPRKIGSFS